MDCLIALLFGVALLLVGAYALGYSVMGWIVKPLEDSVEEEDEVVIQVRVEDDETDGGEEAEEL